MPIQSPVRLTNKPLIVAVMLLSVSASVYAQDFHSTYFSISLADKLTLISKNEGREFSRYIFASAPTDNAELQMRIIVSNKRPEVNQSTEEFAANVIGNMSGMFLESYNLYSHLNTAQNQKILNGKLSKYKLKDTTFAGITLYLGKVDATFLTTRANNMTYAFTLVSKNDNEKVRISNLKMLTNQLQSLRFNSGNR